jgi:hypothetical protein
VVFGVELFSLARDVVGEEMPSVDADDETTG